MSDILRLTTRTRLLGLAAALLLIVFALAPGNVRADVTSPLCQNICPGFCQGYGTTTYYSDASHSTVVGVFTQDCCSQCNCPPCTGSGYMSSDYTLPHVRCTQEVCRSPQ